MSTSLEGSLNDVMKVASLLENAPYQIRVDSFYLNKQISDSTQKSTGGIILPWQAEISFSALSS